jgi:penicillin amidase
MSRSTGITSALLAVVLAFVLAAPAVSAELDGPATIKFDQYRVPTIVAQTEHDAIFLQGYLHAQDRFWQMDFQRRLFSGRVSELVGSSAIAQDVQLRTLGLRRAAERSLAVQTPEVIEWLEAYADGVNAYIFDTSKPLPVEYGALELDRGGIPPWTPLDSLTMAKGLAFGLSFDLSDIDRTIALLTYLSVCPGIGCNGLQLFQTDLYRSAPFEPIASIPPPPPQPGDNDYPMGEDEEHPAYLTDPDFEDLVLDYKSDIVDIPVLENALNPDYTERGSNWWVVSGALTDSGVPLLANDPHLSLGTPATFYEVHLNVTGGINATGISFPGAPGLVQGCNDVICWGSTNSSIDVTDVYNEQLQALDPSQPTTPTHTTFEGNPEPLEFIPQTFLFNVRGDGIPNNLANAGVPASQGGVTLIVPRRNKGPIVNVSVNPATGVPVSGLSVQYTGWSATQDLEAFRLFMRASSMQEFKDALQYFDVGAQNWVYADINGNIAYYTSGELPIREDLQLLFFPSGLTAPYLIRDGTHGNLHEWMPVQNPQPNQSLEYEILPFNEMPQIENPSAGYILNANNDPIGTTFGNLPWVRLRPGFNGRLYLSFRYATGFRMGRLQRLFDDLLAGGGTASEAELIEIQANNQMFDAEVLSPYLIEAYDNATAPDAAPELTVIVEDPRIGDAIGRISAWDFSTPTGIDQGYDPFDNPLQPGPPATDEIDASVAATVYAVWRGQVLQRVIDQTLRNAAGVCSADGATLCSPSKDDCATNPLKPGGICINVPSILGGTESGGDQSLTLLRRLLDNYNINGGTGSSLINFFEVPGVADQAVARDIILLESLQAALDLLASPAFSPAFDADGDGTTSVDDFRWGRLHRIVLAHPLGPSLSIPPAGSPSNLAPDLPGFSRAGGLGVLDASSHNARADGLNEFMFDSGPSRRMVASLDAAGPVVKQVIPGGQSGNAGSPQQTDQLFLWLVNDYHPLPVSLDGVNEITVDELSIECGDGVVGPGEQCDDGNLDENDGCNQVCRITPIITCSGPEIAADADTCTVGCPQVSSCSDPEGGAVSSTCDPAGPFGLGTTPITIECVDAQQDTTVVVCEPTVIDVTPPSISFEVSPDTLWPPNHQMVEVTATVTASDTCGGTSVSLDSIVSDEEDDAAGAGDGATKNDIQAADYGTADLVFELRSERAGTGDGRVYTVTYTATDESGNQTSATAGVDVPLSQGGMTDPVQIQVEENASGTAVTWTAVTGAQTYNVIRSRLEDIIEQADSYMIEPAHCVEAHSRDENTYGKEDAELPEPGKAFVYLVEYEDGGTNSGYGTESAALPRVAGEGNCR